MIVVLAKLCGEDKPLGIAEWATASSRGVSQAAMLEPERGCPATIPIVGSWLIKCMQKKWSGWWENTTRQGEHGKVYALDGKAVRGMRKKDEEGNEYLLSVYDVEQAKVMAQVEVGRKENEITKAPKALKMVEISQKVVTGDAMHTQRGLAAQILEAQGDYVLPVKENQPQLYKNIQSLFAPEYPKPGFGKIQTDFLTCPKSEQGTWAD